LIIFIDPYGGRSYSLYASPGFGGYGYRYGGLGYGRLGLGFGLGGPFSPFYNPFLPGIGLFPPIIFHNNFQ